MIAAWQHRQRTRVWVVLLLLPALLSRVIVPPGFMPGSGADHAPTMQMCHGAGPLPRSSDAPPADHRGGSDRAAHQTTCVFAATGMSAPPPVVMQPSDGQGAPHAMPARPLPAAVYRSPHQPYSPRAPPPPVVPA
jgi:hypothetical protein